MTIPQFPTISPAIPIPREIIGNVTINETVSGARSYFPLWTYPRYRWTLSWELVRSYGSYTEWQTLHGFIAAQQTFNTVFNYNDPDDNAVTAQALGTGDGTTTQYQLVRTMGISTDPVFSVNGTPTIYLDGISIGTGGINRPAAVTVTDAAGGSLGATTYYARASWVTRSGETLGSIETNHATGANKVITVVAPVGAPASATGWNVYVSDTAGGGSGAETRQNGSTPITIGTDWVEPTSGLVAGAALPSQDTTGWSINSYGLITFRGAPKTGVAVTWTGAYFWYCRLDSQSVKFSKFAQGFRSVDSISFSSEKF